MQRVLLFTLLVLVGVGCESRAQRFARMAPDLRQPIDVANVEGYYANLSINGGRGLWETLHHALRRTDTDAVVRLQIEDGELIATRYDNGKAYETSRQRFVLREDRIELQTRFRLWSLVIITGVYGSDVELVPTDDGRLVCMASMSETVLMGIAPWHTGDREYRATFVKTQPLIPATSPAR